MSGPGWAINQPNVPGLNRTGVRVIRPTVRHFQIQSFSEPVTVQEREQQFRVELLDIIATRLVGRCGIQQEPSLGELISGWVLLKSSRKNVYNSVGRFCRACGRLDSWRK